MTPADYMFIVGVFTIFGCLYSLYDTLKKLIIKH